MYTCMYISDAIYHNKTIICNNEHPTISEYTTSSGIDLVVNNFIKYNINSDGKTN